MEYSRGGDSVEPEQFITAQEIREDKAGAEDKSGAEVKLGADLIDDVHAELAVPPSTSGSTLYCRK